MLYKVHLAMSGIRTHNLLLKVALNTITLNLYLLNQNLLKLNLLGIIQDEVQIL